MYADPQAQKSNTGLADPDYSLGFSRLLEIWFDPQQTVKQI
jgi:hypothetical protein